MNFKASGRAALIIAAGLLVLAHAPLNAAPAASGEPQAEEAAPKASKRTAHRHYRHYKHASSSSKESAKDTAKSETKAETKAGNKATDVAKSGDDTAADVTLKADEAKAAESKPVKVMAVEYAKPNGVPQTEPKPLASRDLPPSVANAYAQLADAAAVESPPTAGAPDQAQAAQQPAQTGIVAADEVNELDRAAAGSAQPPANYATVAQVSSVTGNDGSWDKASLIGKIFIAVGGLLTLASAARMFLA